MLANLCNITPYVKPSQDSFLYIFDLFAQEYFFFCFQRLNAQLAFIMDLNEGQSLLQKEKVEEIAKELVFFYPDAEKRKFVYKMNKISKKVELSENESFEGVDIDKMFEYAMDEYFEMKKRNFKALSKKFNKTYESENGLISYDDFKIILNEVVEGESPISKYCFSNDIIKLKTYIYSLTSGKNKNDIVYKDFNSAILKFGIDCPFPLISQTKRKYTIAEKDEKKSEDLNEKGAKTKGDDSVLEKSMDKSNNSSFLINDKKMNSFNFASMENSAFFGQHFTILRELKSYCTQFKEVVATETNTQTIMNHFDNIANIIELACQFLAFPVKV